MLFYLLRFLLVKHVIIFNNTMKYNHRLKLINWICIAYFKITKIVHYSITTNRLTA